MSGEAPPDVTWVGLLIAALPMFGVMAVLAWRRIGQVGPMALAAARMVLQLSLLGVVLRWVFLQETPWVVLGVALVMLTVSAHTVGTRQDRPGWTIRAEALLTLAVGVALVMSVSIGLALRPDPWFAPRVVIPLLGMVLGNSVNAVALAADRLDGELRADRDRIELRLSLGATPRQAARPAVRAATRAALTPIINSMMIAGIVAIPGMTTGQILAGADVGLALRYQILIYLGITGTVGTTTLLLLAIRLRHYFTPSCQLRRDRFDTPAG